MTLWDLCEKSKECNSVEDGKSFRERAVYVLGMVLKKMSDRETGSTEGDMERWWRLVCKFHQKGKQEEQEMGKWDRRRAEEHLQTCRIYMKRDMQEQKKILTEEELTDYFYYRHVCCGKTTEDHGIVGGLFLCEALRRETWDWEKGSQAFCALICHNAIISGFGSVHRCALGARLLELLLMGEAIDPLCYCSEEENEKIVCRWMQALEVEVWGKGVLLIPDTEYIPFDRYAEQILCAATKTGFWVSMDEKNCKIYIRGGNADDC